MRTQAEIESFSPTSALDGVASFFLVGIGGAGMSALARMLKHRGFHVSGTDSTASPETSRLIVEGFNVHIGHSGEALTPQDALVVSDAIGMADSPESARAIELGIPIVRRSQALGWLLRRHKVIAVTGTHGKTTTTGMIGAGMLAAGLDPLIVVGAHVPEFGGSVVEGKGAWAVVEACEAYDALADIQPNIVVLTNLELDHVDFHKNYENLRESVLRFVQKLPEDGAFVFCGSDKGALEVKTELDARPHEPIHTLLYGPESGREGWDKDLPTTVLLPGLHNRVNLAGAIKALEAIPLTVERLTPAVQAMAAFGGADRRLRVAFDGTVTVIDDYAHHPTEIDASIQALRERYPGRRLIVVYQPHLYSRTAGLVDEFAKALSKADIVVLTDIYPAREAPLPGVSSARIAELIEIPCRYTPSRHLLPREVFGILKDGDVVVGMGAGTIAEFVPAFINEMYVGPSQDRNRIVVAYGGDSAEREVSIHSGIAIHNSLKRRGYSSSLVDLSDVALNSGSLDFLTGADRPDLVFLAVHGTNAEDGAIQGLLELMHVPYTGSGIRASAIAMDKRLTKSLLAVEGLKVPKGEVLRAGDLPKLQPPVVVKPNAQGSTVGLSFVERIDDMESAVQKAFAYDATVLVEEWLQGMEISVPVLGDKALPVVEIVPTTGRYDFASKYLPGATEEIVPARLPDGVLRRAQEIAVKVHKILGCEGATRTDMIVSPPYHNAEPVVLEINTLPGMTATSLLPNSARAAGMEFDDLVVWMVEDALARHGKKA